MRNILSIFTLLLALSLGSSLLMAQPSNDAKIDSLRKVLFTQKGEARAHTLFQLGIALTNSDLDQSLSSLNSALTMGQQYNDEAFVAKCNLQLASNEIRRGKWTEAISHAIEALPYFESRRDSSQLTQLYGIMGNAYNDLGLTDQSLKYQLEALEHIDISSSSPVTLGRAYNNVANLYTKLDEVEKATDFYQRALSIFKDAGDTIRYITIMNNMSAIYDIDEVEIALDTLNKALAIAERLGNSNIKSMVYFNIAYQKTRSGKPETGWRYLQLSKEEYQKSQFRYLPPQFLMEEAAIYRNRKRYDSVEVILNRLLKVAKDQNMLQFEVMAYDQLGSLYKTLDNSEKALYYIELSTGIKDSLERAKQENLLAGLKIDNEFSRKQEELDQRVATQKTADRKNRFQYWASVGFLMLVIAGLIYYIMRLRSKS